MINTEKPPWGVLIKFVLYCIVLYCIALYSHIMASLWMHLCLVLTIVTPFLFFFYS